MHGSDRLQNKTSNGFTRITKQKSYSVRIRGLVCSKLGGARRNSLFLADKLARASVHVGHQLRLVSTISVDHVPNQIVLAAVPIQHVGNRKIRSFLKDLVPAVLLGRSKCRVGIHLQESYVEGASRQERILGARGHAARNVLRFNSRPNIRT